MRFVEFIRPCFRPGPLRAALEAALVGRVAMGLFTLVVAGYTATHASALLRQAQLTNYLRDLSVNDTFYYYQIARNLARGRFSTFDGVELTNGYHPLWAWLLTPWFWLEASPEAALPYLKGLELGLLGLAVILLGATLRTLRSSPWFALCSLVPLLQETSVTRGMEGAAAVAGLAASVWLTCRAVREPGSRVTWGASAIALAMLPFARLELLVVTVTVSGLLWTYARTRRLKLALPWSVFFGLALAPVVLYFAFNELVFGAPVPVSGLLKSHWSAYHWERDGGYDLLENLRGTLKTPGQQKRLLTSLALFGIVGVSWLRGTHRRRTDGEHGLDLWLLAASLCLTTRLTFSVLFLMPRFSAHTWYFAPTDFLFLSLPALLAHRLYRLVESAPAATLALLLGSAFLFGASDWSTTEYLKRLERARGVDWEIADYRAAIWMKRHLPPDAVVGSSDAGVYAYFTDFRVINLDGLVNTVDFYQRQRAQKLASWVARESGITHFANFLWPGAENDGCRVMARRMRQDAPVPGRCRLLYRGLRTGKRQVLVFSYDPPAAMK